MRSSATPTRRPSGPDLFDALPAVPGLLRVCARLYRHCPGLSGRASRRSASSPRLRQLPSRVTQAQSAWRTLGGLKLAINPFPNSIPGAWRKSRAGRGSDISWCSWRCGSPSRLRDLDRLAGAHLGRRPRRARDRELCGLSLRRGSDQRRLRPHDPSDLAVRAPAGRIARTPRGFHEAGTGGGTAEAGERR
jgi:hypothetical protein